MVLLQLPPQNMCLTKLAERWWWLPSHLLGVHPYQLAPLGSQPSYRLAFLGAPFQRAPKTPVASEDTGKPFNVGQCLADLTAQQRVRTPFGTPVSLSGQVLLWDRCGT